MAAERHSNISAAGDKVSYCHGDKVNWLLNGDRNWDQWFARATIIKSGDKITAAVLAEHNVFIKRYKAVGPLQQLRSLFGFGRASRVFEISERLQSAGVPVAKPIAYGEKNTALPQNSYYACDLLAEDCADLKALYFSDQWQRVDQQVLLTSVAKGLAAMHQAGLCHGDMKWSNIIVQNDAKALWFVDLDGARKTLFNKRDSGRDLARFFVNAKEFELDSALQNSFLKTYADARGHTVEEIQRWYCLAYNKLAERHRVKYQSKI